MTTTRPHYARILKALAALKVRVCCLTHPDRISLFTPRRPTGPVLSFLRNNFTYYLYLSGTRWFVWHEMIFDGQPPSWVGSTEHATQALTDNIRKVTYR